MNGETGFGAVPRLIVVLATLLLAVPGASAQATDLTGLWVHRSAYGVNPAAGLRGPELADGFTLNQVVHDLDAGTISFDAPEQMDDLAARGYRLSAATGIVFKGEIREDLVTPGTWAHPEACPGVQIELGLRIVDGGRALEIIVPAQRRQEGTGCITAEPLSDYQNRFHAIWKLERLEMMTVHFTDANFQELSEIPLYVAGTTGPGTGEVWVEVRAAGDPAFDDTVVDQVTVRVWSTSDPDGEHVTCIETAPQSRIFRSSAPVALRRAAEKVEP
jgi:hypothetical protein